MLAHGVTTIVECGPGKVLTALVKRVEKRPDVATLAIEDPTSLSTALEKCREA
jgi:[acyl-carrier-protein] S-malonyltransferase